MSAVNSINRGSAYDADVVVVGAGPAGLLLAAELARSGVRALVLERDAEARVSPGVALNGSVVLTLERLGLLESLRREAVPLPRVHFGLLWVDLDRVRPRPPDPVLLPQSRLEAVLAEHAAAQGAVVHRGHEVLGLEQDGEGVAVEVRGPDGEPQIVRALFLVGADGPESVVRRAAGIGVTRTAPTVSGLVADAEADPAALAPEHLGAAFSATGLYMGVPVGPRTVRLMTTEFGRRAPDGAPTRDELAAAVAALTGSEPKVEGLYRPPVRYDDRTALADAYRSGRVFLAGDAAHTHYPLGGLALGAALADAVSLGGTLAAAVRGEAPEGLLDSYHAERHPVGRRIITVTRAQSALLHPLERVGPLRELFGELLGLGSANEYLARAVSGLEPPGPGAG
ncbi:FAD-dependent monooxygenase [Streptomyces tsukubensis]|uniref:FAD-dependent monooxygenase n=1 Tax=Streptomyces tsukubensis TaxID=83656 RepID=UPI0036B05B35